MKWIATLPVLLASAARAAAAQTGPAAIAPDKCAELAAEITELTTGAVEAGAETQELSRKNQAPSLVADYAKSVALGTMVSALPGAARGAAITAWSMTEKMVQDQRAREANAADKRMQTINDEQISRMERLGAAHEQYEAQCGSIDG